MDRPNSIDEALAFYRAKVERARNVLVANPYDPEIWFVAMNIIAVWEDRIAKLEALEKLTAEKHEHKPVQHRDGKPPWCPICGLTADMTVPVSRFEKHEERNESMMPKTYTPERIQLRALHPPHNTIEGPPDAFTPSMADWLAQGWRVDHEYLDGEEDGQHYCFYRTGEINGIPYICGHPTDKHYGHD